MCAASVFKLCRYNAKSTIIKDRQDVIRTEVLWVLLGRACCVLWRCLLCRSEIYCAECHIWVRLMIRAKIQHKGREFTAGGHWYCSLNEVRYSEHYMEGTSQQVGTGIVAWMKCVTVNIIWKVLHSRWTLVLQLEWSALQWTLYGRYFTEVGH